MRKLFTVLSVAASVFMYAAPAHAQSATQWQLTPQEDQLLSFSATQMGNEFTGEFSDFRANIAFSPDDLEHSAVSVTVSLASAHTGEEERDETLQSDEWFNSDVFPTASFTANHFEKIPENEADEYEYIAHGTLDIGGIKNEVELPFSFDIGEDGQNASTQGEATLNRMDYNLGAKSWSDEESISHSVIVEFHLALTKNP